MARRSLLLSGTSNASDCSSKVLKLRQLLPLLLASAASERVSFPSILEAFEHMAFVALMCFENQTRWGEKTFELSSKIFSGEMTVEDCLASAQEFFALQLLHPAKRFAGRLPEQLRYAQRRKTPIRYFLTTVNDWGFGETDSPWNEPDIQATWVLSDIHIDHISAQRGGDSIDSLERDRLGNLTPLKGKSNMSLSNKAFTEKQEVYRASPLRITRALGDPSIGRML